MFKINFVKVLKINFCR